MLCTRALPRPELHVVLFGGGVLVSAVSHGSAHVCCCLCFCLSRPSTQPTADYHGTFKPTLNEDKNQTVAATGLGSLASPKPNPAPDNKDYYGTFEPKTNAPLDKRARTVTEAGQRLHGKAAKDTQSRVKSAAGGRAGLQREAAATATELTFAPKTNNTPPPNKRDRQAITQAGHRLHSKAVDAQSRGPSRRAQIEAQRAA